MTAEAIMIERELLKHHQRIFGEHKGKPPDEISDRHRKFITETCATEQGLHS